MTTITGAARPRVLAFRLTDQEIASVRPLAGSLVVADDLRAIHPEEHDVLILADANFHDYSEHFPRRIVFAPEPAVPDPMRGRIIERAKLSNGYSSTKTQVNPARDFEVTPEARELGLESLTWRSCKPEPGATYTGFRLPVYPEREAYPLLREVLSDSLTLAVFLELKDAWTSSPRDSALWLPAIARPTLREWSQFAFARWRADEPTQFPVSAEWVKADQWSSVSEISARGQLIEFDRAEVERREAQNQERARMEEVLSAAESRGTSWRALLTETGDDLVSAVKEALETLGFAVLDSDELPQHKGAKREDLRVTDGEWTALAEVKGYTGAAKSNDLTQVTRAAVAYAMTEQREPDALWYIPNPERTTDPAQRALALVAREDDLTAFGRNHQGCLIDTRDLFALRQRVATGIITAHNARRELKRASGRYISH